MPGRHEQHHYQIDHVYQKIYDKILKDSKNADDVKLKMDPTNLEGVNYWINVWGERYDDFADVSLNVYNTVLDKDLNYTGDRYIYLENKKPDKNAEIDFSEFL